MAIPSTSNQITANSRRQFMIRSSVGSGFLFGLPLVITGNNPESVPSIDAKISDPVSPYFPSTDRAAIKAVVGAAHTQFDRVKELVSARPELAKATYDWGFGDVESALGAASHMGRKDIAEFLIEHGARPNLFTLAMMGKVDAVKATVEAMPGIQKILGPHGITLLQHAEMPLRRGELDNSAQKAVEATVEYLKSIDGAGTAQMSLDITEAEQKKYLGTYKFGVGGDESFLVEVNRRGLLSIKRGENFGRVLHRVEDHGFAPGGAPSVRVRFDMKDDQAIAVTIHDPVPLVKALRTD